MYLIYRTLDPTKIIITGKRVRFNFLGVLDLALFDPNLSNPLQLTTQHQQVIPI